MINIILTGAAGRVGQMVLGVLPNFKGLRLAGAFEAVGHPSLGKKMSDGVVLQSDLAGFCKSAKKAVLVDFSTTSSAITNLKMASSSGIPVVIGVTGFDATQKSEINAMSKIIPIVLSPNMSVGVNVMWKVIEDASDLLGKDYQIDIVETHHVHKKDAPSGTAKKMLEIVDGKGKGKVNVRSIREGEVVGDHTITFTSPYEKLEITHKSFSREVFASGALKAALWVVDKKPGLYGMSDVLNIND